MKPLPNNKPIKPCPECGEGTLLVRTRRRDDRQFLGCSRWPDCAHTEEIPQTVYMEAEGHQKLPGF
jgi:ssDNA-binding Zn-finger/Zn-ribbon topoisomerase 1